MGAFQDRYPERYAHCYGCGRLHPDGWQVKSYWLDDEPGVAVCHFTPGEHYTGGWPHVMYGGVIASLIDCHSGGTASAAKAMELGLADDAEIPRFVTASLTVDFTAPTPVGSPLEIRARVASLEGRKAWVDTEVIAHGAVTVTGRVLMIMVVDE